MSECTAPWGSGSIPLIAMPSNKCLILLRRIDSLMLAGSDGQGNPVAMLQNPKLFQFLRGFRRCGSQSGVDGQKFTAIDIQPDVTKGAGFPVSVPIMGDQCPGEIKGTLVGIKDDLDEIGVRRVVGGGHGCGDGPDLAVFLRGKGLDCRINEFGIDLRFIGLDIHDIGAIEPFGDFSDPAGSIDMIRPGSGGLESMLAGGIKDFIGIAGNDDLVNGS